MMRRIFENHAMNVIMYALCGGVAALVNISLLYLLTDMVGMHYIVSAISAFPFAVLTNYALNKYFNFKNFSRKYSQQITKFATVAIGGLVLNVFFLYVLVEFFNLWYIIAAIISGAIIFFYSYAMHRYWSFNDRKIFGIKLLKEPGFIVILVTIALGFVIHLLYKRYPFCLNLCDPSPLLARMMGSYYGLPPYQDGVLTGVYAIYPWTGLFVLANIAKLLNIDPVRLFMFTGWLTAAIALLLSYFAAKKFGISKSALTIVALLFSIFSMTSSPSGIFGVYYQQQSHFLSFGMFMFSFSTYLRRKSLGIILIILSFVIVSQLHFFNTIYGLALLPGFFGVQYLVRRKKIFLWNLFIAAAYGIVSLSPTIWTWYLNGFKPGHSYHSIIGAYYSPAEFISSMFSSPIHSIFYSFFIIGIILYCFCFKRRTCAKSVPDFVILSFILTLLALGFHHLLTEPLFGFNVVPGRFLDAFLLYSIPLFSGLACARTELLKSIDRISLPYVIIASLAVIFGTFIFMVAQDNSVRHGLGHDVWPFPQDEVEPIIQYVEHNTRPGDVIAANYPIGSVINSLTGRRQIATNFFQANPFADLDKLSADLSLLFFSNNTETIRRISNEYGVAYAVLIGQYAGEFMTSSKYEELFKKNNVGYRKALFNYGGCLRSGHCPPTEVLYVAGAPSAAFFSVFNQGDFFLFNNVLVYFLKPGLPEWLVLPSGNPFVVERNKLL